MFRIFFYHPHRFSRKHGLLEKQKDRGFAVKLRAEFGFDLT